MEDFVDRVALERAADAVEAAFGRIDIICNNASVLVFGKPLETVSPGEWDWIVGTNLYGVINGVQTFVPRIRKHGRSGHVVNTASIGGFQVHPDLCTGPYAMTKFGVVALSEALANDLAGTGIGVSVLAPAAVNPGIYRSPQQRPECFGGPEPGPDRTPDVIKAGMAPDLVGRRLLAAIRDGDFYDAAERWAAAEGLIPERG